VRSVRPTTASIGAVNRFTIPLARVDTNIVSHHTSIVSHQASDVFDRTLSTIILSETSVTLRAIASRTTVSLRAIASRRIWRLRTSTTSFIAGPSRDTSYSKYCCPGAWTTADRVYCGQSATSQPTSSRGDNIREVVPDHRGAAGLRGIIAERNRQVEQTPPELSPTKAP
jgi:hypothetical protein